MRPIRILILLLAIAFTLVLALVRPLQGRATRLAKKHKAHPVKIDPMVPSANSTRTCAVSSPSMKRSRCRLSMAATLTGALSTR